MRRIFRQFVYFSLIFSLFAFKASGKVDPARYGLQQFTDTSAIKASLKAKMDSVWKVHPLLSEKLSISAIEHPRLFVDKTSDFYLIVFLFLFLGLIRFANPRYFQSLFRAFWNPGITNREAKEQLEHASLSNFLMNIFFSMSGGVYMYYMVGAFVPRRHGYFPPTLWLLILVAGVMMIYLVKYLVIRFSGWVFRVESITEQYLFNVFLINKIIAITLLPFILLLAFGQAEWFSVVVVFSIIMIGLLLFNRYLRSWQIFGSFFQYSKFHFFTYLCASELLPLAVLMKLMIRGMHYF